MTSVQELMVSGFGMKIDKEASATRQLKGPVETVDYSPELIAC